MTNFFREKLGNRFAGRVIGFVNETGTQAYPYQLIVKPHPNWEGKPPLKGVLSAKNFATLDRQFVQVIYENGQWHVADVNKPAPPAIDFEPKKKGYVPIQYNPHVNTPHTQYQGGCVGCGKNLNYSNERKK